MDVVEPKESDRSWLRKVHWSNKEKFVIYTYFYLNWNQTSLRPKKKGNYSRTGFFFECILEVVCWNFSTIATFSRSLFIANTTLNTNIHLYQSFDLAAIEPTS
jgi:hypothetical protein